MSPRSIINTITGLLRQRTWALTAMCACLATLAGGALSAAGPAAAKAALHATGVGDPEPSIHTQVSVDGVPNGTVPPPPADAMAHRQTARWSSPISFT